MENLKRWARILDALLACRVVRVGFQGTTVLNFRPVFWSESGQDWFDAEIVPYFREAFWAKKYGTIIDAGAAQGLFAVAARKIQPQARIFAFEPSLRQRILMHKNLFLSRVHPGVKVFPYALWDVPKVLQFRTHGALSSLDETCQLPPGFSYREKIRGVRLDDWFVDQKICGPVLVKMDIEGAEIEAVRGAKDWLSRVKPDLLIQAYHLRDGVRTLERVRRSLEDIGFVATESKKTPGLLLARAD